MGRERGVAHRGHGAAAAQLFLKLHHWDLVHLQIYLAEMGSVNRIRTDFMEMQKKRKDVCVYVCVSVFVCGGTCISVYVRIHINITGSIHFTSAAHTS